MTTITLPRAVVEQALEALIIAWQQQPRWQITESMHNLRAALAQQAHTDDLNQRIKLYVGSRCAPPQQAEPKPMSPEQRQRWEELAAMPQQAEPTGKESLQVESVVAENATTQQQIEQTPPSEYRRGYWAGFAIGKREGRIEAEDEPVQEPVAWLRVIDEAMVTHHLGVADPGDDYETAKRKMNNLLCMAQDIGTYFAKQAEPLQEPVAVFDERMGQPVLLPGAPMLRDGQPLYTAPPRQKPLTQEEIPALAEQVLKLSVYYDVWALLGTDGLVALVRAVEQAHGIKESP